MKLNHPFEYALLHQWDEKEIKKTSLYKNFKAGDLLYGLQDLTISGHKLNNSKINNKGARGIFHHVLKSKSLKTPIIVDELNDRVLTFLIPIPNKNKGTDKFLEKNLTSYLLNYHQFLTNFEKEKYRPGSAVPSKKIHKFRRRSCKAALFLPKSTIHFCLDGINIDQVLSKYINGKLDQSITASELRCIFRNWNTLKEKVIFYYLGSPCSAPWEISDAEMQRWSNYQTMDRRIGQQLSQENSSPGACKRKRRYSRQTKVRSLNFDEPKPKYISDDKPSIDTMLELEAAFSPPLPSEISSTRPPLPLFGFNQAPCPEPKKLQIDKKDVPEQKRQKTFS